MIRVVVVGMGPIGIAAGNAVLADSGLQLVGLVDLHPEKIGKTLGELGVGAGCGGPKVSGSLDKAVANGADVAIVTTTSFFDRITDTLRWCTQHKLHVVSSCEEMAWPTYRHAQLAQEIDAEAKRAGVALLGTGVNPGFLMDYLAVVLSSMTTQVTSVKCARYVDAGLRRKPLQKKVGATMSVDQFEGLAREGKIGHMGIAESVALLAAGLGREVAPGSVKTTLDPVVADREMSSLIGSIKHGQVCGMRNTAHWSEPAQNLTIDLDLVMAVGTKDPHDRIELNGITPLKLRIEGGTPGDTATVASLVNFVRVLPNAKPGLRTMLDVPVAGARRR
jgi:2,4-diaminopentanoate dehydrogenase